jgi:uncharacterized membrane protein YccC
MMRHALRTAVVGAVDVVLIRAFHISHGFWLGMTSIIVLQPYSSGTVRKGLQRVAGTVGGGFLAALLAATIHTDTGIVLVITACSILTLALYAIDYGWYSFFLTPTFVLLSLPYLRDWRFASVRILTTLVGALVSVIAMRVLWPQSLRVELGRLLARSASATATYLHAVLEWWSTPAPARKAAERTLLAPARRACGLTSQDAEEALDRVMLEPGLPTLGPDRRHALETEAALTFTTYIRRPHQHPPHHAQPPPRRRLRRARSPVRLRLRHLPGSQRHARFRRALRPQLPIRTDAPADGTPGRHPRTRRCRHCHRRPLPIRTPLSPLVSDEPALTLRSFVRISPAQNSPEPQ